MIRWLRYRAASALDWASERLSWLSSRVEPEYDPVTSGGPSPDDVARAAVKILEDELLKSRLVRGASTPTKSE